MGGGNPPIFPFFLHFLSLFVHYFLENVTREPPITPQGGMMKTLSALASGSAASPVAAASLSATMSRSAAGVAVAPAAADATLRPDSAFFFVRGIVSFKGPTLVFFAFLAFFLFFFCCSADSQSTDCAKLSKAC